MMFDICIDVDDVDRAAEFYGRGLGLKIEERHAEWAKAMIGEQTMWIMKIPAGRDGTIVRDYGRHWTPMHLDLVIDNADIEGAVRRALDAGGTLDREIKRNPDGSGIANLSDPAGNGIDLVWRKTV